jgi:hypothetical protein
MESDLSELGEEVGRHWRVRPIWYFRVSVQRGLYLNVQRAAYTAEADCRHAAVHQRKLSEEELRFFCFAILLTAVVPSQQNCKTKKRLIISTQYCIYICTVQLITWNMTWPSIFVLCN